MLEESSPSNPGMSTRAFSCWWGFPWQELAFFLLNARGPLARFSLSYYFQLLVFFLTSPHPNFLQALFGPLVSPGKSMFLSSPSCCSPWFHSSKNGSSFAAWGYVLLLIVAQALFYDAIWWGNVNWGLPWLLPCHY